VAGNRRRGSVSDVLGVLALPARPVVVDTTLDLMRRGGAAQQEVVRKPPAPQGPRSSTSRVTPPCLVSSTIVTLSLRLQARTAKACSATGVRTSSRSPAASSAYARRTRAS